MNEINDLVILDTLGHKRSITMALLDQLQMNSLIEPEPVILASSGVHYPPSKSMPFDMIFDLPSCTGQMQVDELNKQFDNPRQINMKKLKKNRRKEKARRKASKR